MAGELISQREKAGSIREYILGNRIQITAALPKHIKTEQFLRVCMTAMSKNPTLYDCTPRSIFGSMLQLAQVGLEPDLLGQAWLIPFRNNKKEITEVQIIFGYQGLADLATRDGRVKYITTGMVYAKDQWSYSYGSGEAETYTHVPSEEDDPGPPRCVYAKAKFSSGDERFVVLLPREVREHAKHSMAYRTNSGPWKTHPEPMWRKTAVLVLCKLLPKSVELATAVQLESMDEAGLSQNLEGLVLDDEPQKPARGRLDDLAEKMDGQNGEKNKPIDKALSTHTGATGQAPSKEKKKPGPKPKVKEGQLSADDRAQNLINSIHGADMATLTAMEDNIKESIKDMPPHLNNKVVSVWGNKKVELNKLAKPKD